MHYDHYYKKFLTENRFPRQLKSLEFAQGFSSVYLQRNGKMLINFSSSDYLNLARHPLLIQRTQEYAQQFGVGLSSSRLVTGNLALFDTLEQQLCIALKKPAALILGAGFQTNISILDALLDVKILGSKPQVFCDRSCHASMLASPLYHAELQRFHHNDLQHLERLLKKTAAPGQKFILAESVYSMEGDQANLAELVVLAKRYDAFLYIDDAHSVGIYGPAGWGSAVEYSEQIPLVMGTFSKALGSYGAYVGCSAILKEYFVNKCKGLIYSTGLSPAILGAIAAAIELMPTLTDARARVLQNAERVRGFFAKEGLNFGKSTTQIVPWVIGDAKKTLAAAAMLEAKGILGTAIQPPTVAVNSARIRFCLTAAHSDEDVDLLLNAIQRVAARL